MSSKWVFSATEIETFDICRRKWAYIYLDGNKPPPSKAAEFGSAVHRVLERYLAGQDIDHRSPEGLVASAGLHHLPKRLPEENIERPIFFLSQGHIFHGYIDFFENVGCQTWLVGDHKTCSDLGRALSSDELKKNVQANIYAQWAFTEKLADKVQLRWVYYRTKSSPKSLCVDVELDKHTAEENFASIIIVADEIASIAKKRPSSSSLPKNTNACFKYGRCAFYAQCKGSASVVTQSPKIDSSEHRMTSSSTNKTSLSFHLYVDCVPTKNDNAYARTIELSELLKPVLSKLQTEKELRHYRLAGYGQHVGLIANYLSEHLKIVAYDNHTAILSSAKTPEGCDTLQTLSAAAEQIVRGI